LIVVVLAKAAQTGLSCFGKNGSNRFEPLWTKITPTNWSRFKDPKTALNFFEKIKIKIG
jgi:hypothetical protein